jgi:hypothetical protein
VNADFAARATDLVETVVVAVHDKAVRPALLAARAVVFGLLVLTMAAVAAVASLVGLVRLLDVYAFGGRVWASDALLGAVCCAAGALAWAKRQGPEAAR